MQSRFVAWRWALLVPLAALYIFSLPQTVQSLDSGEMAASAWNLTLPHPPGYPLYVWLHYAFVRLVPWGAVYHRAALATALLMLSATAALISLARNWTGLAIAAAFATSPIVFLYAVTPDVFALHLLMSSLLIALAFAPPSKRRSVLAGLVFGAGSANHHTTIFLAPILAVVIWDEKDNRVRALALTGGAALTVIAYASLFFMDSSSYYAWREINSPYDVLHHFLRRDYGTFRLSANDEKASVVSRVGYFLRLINVYGAVALMVVVAAACLTWRRARDHRAWWSVLISFCFYVVVFFPRIVTHDSGLGTAVAERFFLLPTLLLGALAVTGNTQVTTFVRPRLQTSLALVIALVAGLQAAVSDVPGLRHDTVIEDFSRNLLTVAREPGVPSILFLGSDTQIYAARYVQAVDAQFASVVVVASGIAFDPSAMRKLRLLLPNLYDPLTERGEEHRDIFSDFMLPNSERYAVTYVMPRTLPGAHTVFYPLGRRIEPGGGTAIADNPPALVVHAPVYMRDSEEWTETKSLYAKYATYDLARSQELLAKGDRVAAKTLLSQTLTWIPYCMPCKQNVCALETDPEAKQRCVDQLAELKASEVDYLR